MKYLKYVYEPCEDSSLLLNKTLEQIKVCNNCNFLNSKINLCEVGVGSGFVISNIANKVKLDIDFFGTDINEFALKQTKIEFEKINKSIFLKRTNLLDNLDFFFDIIIFNAPYLPLEKKDLYENLSIKDKAIYDKGAGFLIIEEFILSLNDKLKNFGFALLIFSSFSKKEKIEKILEENDFEFKIIGEENYFFEKLFCFKIYKKKSLQNFFNLKINSIKYLTCGKHSKIFLGKYKKNLVVIKLGDFKDLQIENFFLKKLKSEKFVPKVFFYSKDFVVLEYLKDKTINEFIKDEKNKEKILKVLNNVLIASQRLDFLKINKYEFTNPYKHIFVKKNLQIKIIDYERCCFSKNPKNTTQFLEFIRRQKKILENKNIKISFKKILEISKNYKKNYKKNSQNKNIIKIENILE